MLRYSISSKTALLVAVLVMGMTQLAQGLPPCPRNQATHSQYYSGNHGTDIWGTSRWNRSVNRPPMPKYDRPFPLGQVTDAFHDTQQTNAEAADFIMYDYEFVGDSAVLNPKGREHMTQIAVRLPQTPFPIVIEQAARTNDPQENQKAAEVEELRRANVVAWLQKFYADDPTMPPAAIAGRVVVAPDFVYPIRAEDALRNYDSGWGGNSGGGRGGRGGHR